MIKELNQDSSKVQSTKIEELREWLRVAEKEPVDGLLQHEATILLSALDALEAKGLSVEEIFNAGFDEGYTSPMGINGKHITEDEYDRGRKDNYNLWLKEVQPPNTK
jgi:hypothetical protein